jgi:hypothetical protein
MKKDEALARMTCLAPVYASFTTVIGSRPLQQATWAVLLYLRVTCVNLGSSAVFKSDLRDHQANS